MWRACSHIALRFKKKRVPFECDCKRENVYREV